jgi:hypothetical protein
MNRPRVTRRRELAPAALSGYVSGPAAATEATARALREAADARAIVLVEGISDQIALETLAARRGRDLDGEVVAIVPMGAPMRSPATSRGSDQRERT